MSALADFLAAERDPIVDLFTRRVAATLPASGLTRSQIVDHLPDLLAEVERALRGGCAPTASVFARSLTAERHGVQRRSLGFDLNGVVREYGLLRDCLLERMQELGFVAPIDELRILSGWMSAATADSVRRYTERREQDLDEERARTLELLQQAPGFVCFLRGPEHVFELANPAYLQLVGHREILGKPVREALPEIAGQGFFEILDEVHRSGAPFVGRCLRVALQRQPGAPLSEAFVDFVYQPILDAEQRVVGILAMGQDVTELKDFELVREAAETALRASEARYRALFAAIDDGFCLMQMLVDEQGKTVDYRFIEANAAFEAHTGLTSPLGHTARELVPDLDDSWFEIYGEVAATGEPRRFENQASAMGRWFEAFASRVGAPEQRLVALVFKDVTARKQAEAEVQRLLGLEKAARVEAERASFLKDEFLTTVSHELRTPLNAILGWSQLMLSSDMPPEQRTRGLRTVERNARAQAQLIEDLLDMSSILSGKLRLEIGKVNVDEVVEAALETVRPAAQAKGIHLQPALASGATLMADAHRLQQVVWNLLANAVKFTPRDGRVQIVVARQESGVELAVSDTGQGISEEFQPHVFERFRQADGGSTRTHGGLGLGLSIVQHLVEMHGGTVDVFSEGLGRGTTFTVSLPLSAVRRRDPSAPPPRLGRPTADLAAPSPPQLDGLRILAVDDEPDTRELLQEMLEKCGARVQLAGSVEEALQAVRREVPELLISDIGMPEQDGYALIDRLRHLPAGQGQAVPAIALTAYARSEDRMRVLLSGFNSHVPKPVEPLELLAVIASLTGRTGNRPS